MRTLIWMFAISIAVSGCKSNDIEGTCIECIIKTGNLWGIREVYANPDGSVTLSESLWEGNGCGLSMRDADHKPSEKATLKVGERCYLTDHHHAFISYTFLRSDNGKLYFTVVDHFDARSFGDGVKTVKRTIGIAEYKNRDNKPQQKQLKTASAKEPASGIVPAVLLDDNLPPQTLGPPPDDGSKPEALRHMLCNGITHRRLIKDPQGRPIRQIFYSSGRLPGNPVKTDAIELVERGTDTFAYDSAGRLICKAQYSAVAKSLGSFVQHDYWANGKQRLKVYRTGDGVRTQEIRYPRDYPSSITKRRNPITELHFDRQTGRRLLYMGGPIPDDHDLADGWGPEAGALQCGITATRGVIMCTIANIGDRPSLLVQDTDGKKIRLELRDASGKAVPYHKTRHLSNIRHGGPASLCPGHATYEHHLLGDWFGDLPPGKYTARVARRSTGRKFDMVSNIVLVEVPAPTKAPPASGK
jgi:hypothetical protein